MLIKALRVGNIRLYTTGLSEEDLKDIYVEPVSSVEEAVRQAFGPRGTGTSPSCPKALT